MAYAASALVAGALLLGAACGGSGSVDPGHSASSSGQGGSASSSGETGHSQGGSTATGGSTSTGTGAGAPQASHGPSAAGLISAGGISKSSKYRLVLTHGPGDPAKSAAKSSSYRHEAGVCGAL